MSGVSHVLQKSFRFFSSKDIRAFHPREQMITGIPGLNLTRGKDLSRIKMNMKTVFFGSRKFRSTASLELRENGTLWFQDLVNSEKIE